MQNTQSVWQADFTENLTQLRQTLADADPQAAIPTPETAQAAALSETLASAFVSAPATERPHLLLRALDEAIAAVEISARLADQLHGPALEAMIATPATPATPATDEGSAATPPPEEPLHAAYRAFLESQPGYQALYHYRNALAASLRVESRTAPEATQQPTEAASAGEPTAKATPDML